MSHRLPSQFCDGLNRRSFLRAGGLAMGGLTLPELLRAQGENRHRLGHKACIMIFLAGGPPHQDMFDLKPEAPSEIRGEFSPISTNLPGVQICEHLPQLATRLHRYSLIRSIYGAKDRHDAFQCLTGRLNENQPVGGWPSLGSVSHIPLSPPTLTVPPTWIYKVSISHNSKAVLPCSLILTV